MNYYGVFLNRNVYSCYYILSFEMYFFIYNKK